MKYCRKRESTSSVTYFKMKLKNLHLFNVFFFLLPVVVRPIFCNALSSHHTSTTTKISKKTPHFDEKVNFISIFKKTERKFWQKHFQNFGFLGIKFCATKSSIIHLPNFQPISQIMVYYAQ